MQLPKVAIVGRSNVGKSTLFNKIVEERKSVVSSEAGTTRDRLETPVAWGGRRFMLVDTGGVDPKAGDVFREQILKQVQEATRQATVIVLMVDVKTGILPEDTQLVKVLRKQKKPVLLAVNKCDNPHRRAKAKVFEQLGYEMNLVSASNGSGVGDLLDIIISHLGTPSADELKLVDVTLALIGRPNVGKSSMFNAVVGEERMIVSDEPHTTRDSQDVTITYKDIRYTVIDTAGVRRHTARGDDVEMMSIGKTMGAVRRADVVALVVDISEPISSQDKRLANEIETANKGIFIVANKWDLIPDKDPDTINTYETYLRKAFPNLSWVPIVFTSAAEGIRTRAMLELAHELHQSATKELKEEDLKAFIGELVVKRKPTIGKGTRRPRLLSLVQEKSNPPCFRLEIPNKTNLAQSYKQFIINSMRDKFDYEGIPLSLRIIERQPKPGDQKLPPARKKLRHRRRPQPKRR